LPNLSPSFSVIDRECIYMKIISIFVAAPAAVAAPSTSGDAIPSVESAEFEKFIENESNLMKWVDSVSK